ncbi:bacteriochlorophyll 4-vinyl reductase [Alterisphingorhabdus coralli]|uniref:Bacteriochlorophyll 4-vinyl reductase n=1 Tax=Alterisphingorhabdus coralli TaxID=3071408 RepID=A0AA97F6R5_9SPHN|nr:bacteriochlorophyll 4-vinyl reductase [Parasphingorhabdus sp. SCSIO 66989]WOE74971.1 bacteriochlorophyll 4-vinyl reductase [Parasphingorhabdus sp. SCSIO 66989]
MHGARIGPNALTQLIEPIERRYGHDMVARLLEQSGIQRLPDMTGLIDEDPVIAMHHHMIRTLPDMADDISREAGARTGAYIIANRIPGFAQGLLRILPAALSARLLAKAIAKNAWTFAGSGKFAVQSWWPLVFTLEDNPFAKGLRTYAPACHWHAAVFETLFRELVSPHIRVTETTCCAAGDPRCTFVVRT